MKGRGKQIAAIAAIVIIVALYIVTLILGITNNENTSRWFTAAITATVVLPVMAWVYIWIFKKITEQRKESESIGTFSCDEEDKPED